MVNGLINTLVAFLMGGATLSFSFAAADAGGEVVSTEGTIISVGENYRMETTEVVIAYNGKELGIYQKGIDEIVLQPAGDVSGANAAALMSNPFSMLTSGAYEVIPSVADSRGIPSNILLKSKTGAQYTIKILKYAAVSVSDSALFTLNPENYPTAVVTDLR